MISMKDRSRKLPLIYLYSNTTPDVTDHFQNAQTPAHDKRQINLPFIIE